MAIRKGNFMSGKLKNIVFRKQKNVQIMQTKPRKGHGETNPGNYKKGLPFWKSKYAGKIYPLVNWKSDFRVSRWPDD
jgi:hypothetical protein